jgi:hypothetical protein
MITVILTVLCGASVFTSFILVAACVMAAKVNEEYEVEGREVRLSIAEMELAALGQRTQLAPAPAYATSSARTPAPSR